MPSSLRPNMNDFPHALLRVAIAQTISNAGYNVVNESTLETLTDITQKFIESLGTFGKDNAELAGRTEVNLLDMLRGYTDMHPGDEYTLHTNFNAFIEKQFEVPFARDGTIPEFPAKRRKHGEISELNGSIPLGTREDAQPKRGKHIPSFAPPFPKAHTYVVTEVNAVERWTDPEKIRKEDLHQRSTIQGNLAAINDRLKESLNSKGENVAISTTVRKDIFSKIDPSKKINRFSFQPREAKFFEKPNSLRADEKRRLREAEKEIKIVSLINPSEDKDQDKEEEVA